MPPRRSLAVIASAALALSLGTATTASAQRSEQAAAPAQQTRPGDLPAGTVVTDGSVNDLVRDGDRIYATGWFTRIGRYHGAGDRLDAADGTSLDSPQLADGQISVLIADGAGGWYLGGDFTAIGEHESGGLAHVLADGSLDPAFLPVTNGLVSAIALAGTTLYVGGDFTKVGAVSRDRLAAVSTVDGSVLPFDAPQTQRVTELVAAPTSIYVGTEDHLVAVDPVTGGAVAGFSSSVSKPVHALALGGGHLYVGTDELVALDPSSGAVDPGFDGGTAEKHRSVHSLLWTDSRLYVGSDRTRRLVAVDPDTGAVDPTFSARFAGENGTFGGPGGVYDLALDGTHLWVAGSFTWSGGVSAHGLAVLDAASGSRVDMGLPTYDKQVNAVELSGGGVFVGGTFSMTDWVHTTNIAALDADTLEPDPGFRVRGRTYGELVATPDALYLTANHFQGYSAVYGGQQPYSNYTVEIDALNPATGAPRPKLSLKVRNLTGSTLIDGKLYVAQRLDNDERFPRNRITVYDGRHRVRSFRVPLPGYISTLSSVHGDLLVGGSFKRSTHAGSPRNTALLRLDPRTGKRRAYFDPHIHGPVYELAVDGGSIYASGLFRKVFEGTHLGRPGVTKMDARSTRDEEFAPKSTTPEYDARLRVLGDVLWFDAWRGRFLDLTTGARADGPSVSTGDRPWAISTRPGGFAFSSTIWPNLGGHSYTPTGFITAVD